MRKLLSTIFAALAIHCGAATYTTPEAVTNIVIALATNTGTTFVTNITYNFPSNTPMWSPYALSGSNVVISPTNGAVHRWDISSTVSNTLTLDGAAAASNAMSTMRLEILGSNFVSFSGNISNTAALTLAPNGTVWLFDKNSVTNLWWGARMR